MGTRLPRWTYPYRDQNVTLVFKEDTIEGYGGCNTYGGSYTTSKDSLSLDGVYWTEMGCMEPEGILQQESAYFDALTAAASYRVDGDHLEIYDETGTQVLVFVAADKAPTTRATPTKAPHCPDRA